MASRSDSPSQGGGSAEDPRQPQGQQGSRPATRAKSRSHISRACKVCRQKKIKCDGETPCGPCIRFNIQCVYLERDGRRREERESRFRALQSELSDLQSALDSLQVEDEDEALSAFYALRATSHSDGSSSTPRQSSLSMSSGQAQASSLHRPQDTFEGKPAPVYVEQALSAKHAIKANNISPQLLQAIIAFRNWAQSNITAFGDPASIIGTEVPDLELFMRARREGDRHTVWSWACELAKSYSVPVTLQLSILYVLGVQMRYLVNPCDETLNSLPQFLRPQDNSRGFVADGISYADTRLPNQTDHVSPSSSSPTPISQSTSALQWPYSDASCLTWIGNAEYPTLSQAFMEHITDGHIETPGPRFLRLVPIAPHLTI